MATLSMIPGHRGHGQHGVEDQITCSCHGVNATRVPGQWHELVLYPTSLAVCPAQGATARSCSSRVTAHTGGPAGDS